MSWGKIKYIEQSFITDSGEINRQLRNTALFLYLAEKSDFVPLSYYLEGTQYGYTASAKESGNIKLLRITDIKDGSVVWESVPFCTCNDQEKYILKQNDILVARTGGTTGKSYYFSDITHKSVFASYLIRVRVKEDYEPEFIYAFLNSYTYWSQLLEMKSGAAQPNVNAEKLKKLFIPKCTVEDQRLFISVLKGATIDEELCKRLSNITETFQTIQALQPVINQQFELISKLRQQILQEAIQGKLVPQDPNDEPAAELLKKIKAEKEQFIKQGKLKKEKPLVPLNSEELPNKIPESWKWTRLSEICIEIVDCPHSTPKYLDTDTGFYGIDTNCINERGDITHLRSLSKESYLERVRRITPQEKDIVYTREGSIGNATFIPAGKNICLGQRVMLFRPSAFMVPDFLKYIVTEERFKGRLLSKHRGMGAKHVNVRDIINSIIPIPPINEQYRITAKIDTVLLLCSQFEQIIYQNQKYTQELTQVVLKEALTGM